ncbi:MAG TPA: MFS transporter [Candidatus Lumbricidophila sp.]|nr:MFS transporter [Candidatus Lumbricidophila sp.]
MVAAAGSESAAGGMPSSGAGVNPGARTEVVPDPAWIARVQRRTVLVLAAGQVLGGLAFGATISLGAVLAAHVSGDDSLAGLAAAAITLGTAIGAIPLAALAQRAGRRVALTLGMLIASAGVVLVIVATGAHSFVLLLAAFALLGLGQAVNLQSRFAASDLATNATRGRDLSLVVWATTIGAVLGPNLTGLGEVIGQTIGMPRLTGAYLFTIVGQALIVVLYLVALRPDPLLLAQRLAVKTELGAAVAVAPSTQGGAAGGQHEASDRPRLARFAIFAVAAAHGVMVSIMAMTPVHLLHQGAELTVIGITISVHVAGMFALSPVFGVLADRVGRITTVLIGQALLAVALVIASLGAHSTLAVTLGLLFLGLGWSAVTVSGSALLSEASAAAVRTRRQGRSDFAMNFVAAIGAVVAGVILGWIGYGGLALVVGVAVIAVVVLAPLAASTKRD